MIKPTVGRVVWYLDPLSDWSQPQAALVCYVHSDVCVNLAVFDRNGCAVGKTSVPLHQGEGEPPPGPHAAWMPFQVGQAKAAGATP